MGQTFTRNMLSDAETLEKLRMLHPAQTCDFKLPDDAPIIAGVSPEELRAAGRRLAKGVSPGPTGTTDNVLRLLLDDEVCCTSLCHMMADLLNGFLSRQVLRRLNRARLIAIPKPDGGVRPVAMGDVFGKLAGIILFQRYENTLEPLFAPMQQGIMSKAGCERIVHTLHEKYLTGHSILSVDLKNAFNTPSRNDVAKHVFGIATLRPFQRYFAAEYSEQSQLLFYGSEGKLVDTVSSSSGVKQGSPLSTLYFCTYLQPVLETLAEEFPGINIHAYIDDINLTSEDPNQLTNAFKRLKALVASSNLALSAHKCVWFGGILGKSIPEALQAEGVQTESQATKVLGAFIGEDDAISQKLLQKIGKQEVIFRRLKLMGMSNVSLILLTKSVNVRQQYYMRTHNPKATDQTCKRFYSEIENVLQTWMGPLQTRQIDIARLPLKKGGLGLTACHPTRAAAYEASRHAAFEHIKSFSARVVPSQFHSTEHAGTANEQELARQKPPTDEITAAAKLHEEAWNKLVSDPQMAGTLKATSNKGSYDWLLSNVRYVPPHLFELAVMPRLGVHHPRLPDAMTCPGCRTLMDANTALTHIPGCVQCTGFNATAKHNMLTKFLYDLCMKAGIPCEREPRSFSTWSCLTCGNTVDYNNQHLHHKTCGGRQFHRSGPDLAIYWNSGVVFYDLTVVHELAPSHRNKKCSQLVREAIQRKNETYVNSGMIPAEAFECLPVLSCGSLHKSTRGLIKSLTDVCLLDTQKTEQAFKLLLQELNGSEVYAQLRHFLEPQDYQKSTIL